MLANGIDLADMEDAPRAKAHSSENPGTLPIRSWSERWFLRIVAEAFGRRVVYPALLRRAGFGARQWESMSFEGTE